VIRTFADKATRDVFDGIVSKAARRLPMPLHPKAGRLLDQLNTAARLGDLSVPPGNHLEALAGDRKGFRRVRVNRQWRIVFRWTVEGVCDVEIVDYH
jgi:proteic killer suppression protein